jgi:hypothetical protein
MQVCRLLLLLYISAGFRLAEGTGRQAGIPLSPRAVPLPLNPPARRNHAAAAHRLAPHIARAGAAACDAHDVCAPGATAHLSRCAATAACQLP